MTSADAAPPYKLIRIAIVVMKKHNTYSVANACSTVLARFESVNKRDNDACTRVPDSMT